ncbi:hypothetical protein M422DRAFT_775291 [Sphaerobolus stellatus SS14]|nr:hypothetical protein M422DRAFT_775291 [Sphaerobolus stellatus SS14]
MFGFYLGHLLSGLLAFCHIHGAAAAVITPTKGCFSPINWTPCTNIPNVQCATYDVPLDYADPNVGTTTIALTRVLATKQPRLGTLFINPGGPGGSGVSFAQGRALSSVAFTNGQYDLLGWDPRGINGSSPKFSCGFETIDEFNSFVANSFFTDGFEARGNLSHPEDLQRFFASVPAADDLITRLSQKCAQANGGFLKYMGTPSVVRDILAISDCLEGPGKLVNFYGFSYGTVIGNYLVNMFPERVGRIIIDGVVDSIVWATEPSFRFFDRSLQDTEPIVLPGFLNMCAAAGPGNCAFAIEGSTGASLLQEYREMIDTVFDLHQKGLTNITSFQVRDFVYSNLPSPTIWASVVAPQLASWRITIKAAANGQSSATVSTGKRAVPVIPSPQVQSAEADIIVRCLDSIDQHDVTTTRVFQEIVNVSHVEAPLYGITMLAEYGGIFCHRFPVRGVERFQGPFNRKLANPILVVGNKGDPRTPLENAQKIASTLGNSARLLIQNGFGHTSLAETSSCTLGTVRAFLVNGTLPPVGQVCPVDTVLFPTTQAAVGN